MMRVKANQELRQKIKDSDYYTYEVASKLGCSENTLIRILRTELSDAEKQKILDALDQLTREDKQISKSNSK
jgi:hypothetical protein